jgi:hypothetical protein
MTESKIELEKLLRMSAAETVDLETSTFIDHSSVTKAPLLLDIYKYGDLSYMV